MANLIWKECLTHEECFKSEGAETTWYINPTLEKKWYLSWLHRRDKTLDPEEVGLFLTIQEAMDKAEELESAGAIHSVPATGPSMAQARIAHVPYADRLKRTYKPRLGLWRLLKGVTLSQ